MNQIQIPYGNTELAFEVKKDDHILDIKEPEKSVNKDVFLKEISENIILNNSTNNKVGVIVSDKTRLCGYKDFLAVLLEYLEHNGTERQNITVYIAYGTHPKQTEEECLNSYGEVYHKYKFIHHNCHDLNLFKNLGYTERGTPVMVRKDLEEQDMLITMGAVSHHYFAGFGGGRKLLFPGLGEKKAIYHNHGLYLDSQSKRLQEYCQPGLLNGNPLAEDLRDIISYLPDFYSIHGILNTKGQVCYFKYGSTYKDFVQACEEHDKYYRCSSDKKYDLVIASCGGYPKDINLIQSHKAIHYASRFVKDYGTLIMASECRDGTGSKTFLPYFQMGGFNEAFRVLLSNYEGNGGTALSMMSKTQRITIKMITQLDKQICDIIGVHKINRDEAMKHMNHFKGECAFIKNASMLVQ